MSRSADRAAVTGAAAVGLLIVGLLIAGLGTQAARADSDVAAVTAPVVDIRPSVQDISLGYADLSGAVQTQESVRSLLVTLDATVLFGFDSARLSGRARGKIRAAAAALHRRGAGRVDIVGYTDNLGSAAHGLDLSRRRAHSVARALRPLLPRADYPFRVSGRGEAHPVASNKTERTRRLNRRVELTLTGGS